MTSQDVELNLVVLGGGPAGVTAALRAAELGARVTLVERGRLGGTCTNDGCAPTRVLARAARLARDTQLFEAYGLEAADARIHLDRLLARTRQTVADLHAKKDLVAHLARAGVVVRDGVGEAAFADAHTLVLAGGERLCADRFVLCAGGRPRPLSVPGGQLALTHRDVWALQHTPVSMIVIGAAATGCQLASVFAALGTRVTLLDLAPRILPGEDEAVSAAVTNAFARRGISVHTSVTAIERIEHAGDGLRVTLSQPTGQLRIDAACVIAATGWVGNADALGLEAAGVATQRGFVTVDAHQRTNQPHIFAAGDITGRVMLVQTAQIEARIAAESAVTGIPLTQPATVVPHGGFTDPDYAGVGLTEALAVAQFGDGVVVATVPFARVDRAVIDGRGEGFCKLIVRRDDGRLIGAHVVGEQAVEIVHVAATAMAGELTVGQVAGMAFAYPTYTAVIGQAAAQAQASLEARAAAPVWRELAGVAGR